MDREQLRKAVDEHARWLDSAGRSGKRLRYHGARFVGWVEPRIRLRQALLPTANFAFLTTPHADFSSADLAQADFINAHLPDAVFHGANLTRAVFVGAWLSKADFTGANLTYAMFRGVNLTEVNFTGASLEGADFVQARPYRTNFSGVRGVTLAQLGAADRLDADTIATLPAEIQAELIVRWMRSQRF